VALGAAVVSVAAAFLAGDVVHHIALEGGAEFFVTWARPARWNGLLGLRL